MKGRLVRRNPLIEILKEKSRSLLQQLSVFCPAYKKSLRRPWCANLFAAVFIASERMNGLQVWRAGRENSENKLPVWHVLTREKRGFGMLSGSRLLTR